MSGKFPQKEVLKHVKTQCNRRLRNHPRGNMLRIDGIKQDGKVEVPWILIAHAAREDKNGFVRA